jgi:transposase-like protein
VEEAVVAVTQEAYTHTAGDNVFASMGCRCEHWREIASTKQLEQTNRDIDRRSDVDCVFPNDGAITRLFGAKLIGSNDEWTGARRDTGLESLALIPHLRSLQKTVSHDTRNRRLSPLPQWP